MVFINFLCQWNITIVSSHLVSKKVIYHRGKLLLTANIDDLINQELDRSSCRHTYTVDPEKYNYKIFPPLVPHVGGAVSPTSHPPPSVTNECEPFSIIIHASTSCCSPPPPATGTRAWEGTPRVNKSIKRCRKKLWVQRNLSLPPVYPCWWGAALGEDKEIWPHDLFSQHTRNKIITDNKEYVLEV